MNNNGIYPADMEQSGQMDNSSGVDIPQQSLLQVVWRRHKLVGLVVLLCLVAGFIYIQKATPIYTSESRLYVEQSGPKIISEQEGLMTQSKNYLYTQSALLTSTPILAAVVANPAIARLHTFAEVDNPIAFLKKKISAQVGKKDDIITVSFDSPWPQEAAQIVNAVVDSYVTFNANTKRTTATKVLNILKKAKELRDKDLKAKYKAILDFKMKNPAMSLENNQGNIMIQNLSKLLDALTDARIETINARANYEVAKLMVNDPAQMQQLMEMQRGNGVYVSMNQEETQLRTEMSQLQLQLVNLRQTKKLTKNHPMVKALESQIQDIKNQLTDIVKKKSKAYLEVAHQEWLSAKQRQDELQKAADAQQKEAQKLNVKVAEYDIMQSDLTRTEKLCDSLDDRIKNLNVTENAGALNISILEVAHPADKPSKPQKARIMAMALVLGIMLGIGLALLLDWTDQRLRSADEITAIMGVPVLGTVPSMKGAVDITERGQKVAKEPASAIAEAYKTIRTAVYFGVPAGEAKTVLITSPSAGDGKSTMATNLALAMAQAGQKCVVIDCDFRKPMLHQIFECKQKPGLSDVLSGQAKLDDVLRDSSEANLKLIPSGPVPVNPSELLNSKACMELIKELAERFDRVIIDSPPVMPVTDARILGALCDITLLVLRADKSTRKASQQARDGLLSVGANILGVVVNDVHPRKGYYGYYSSYGYYGHKYYGHKKAES